MARILVVEDEVHSARALDLYLTSQGHEVRLATRASEAFATVEGFEPEILLTDLVLPEELDGLEVAEILRRDRPGLPVILMSGLPEHEIVERAREARCFDVHPKPVRLAKIRSSVERAAERLAEGVGGEADLGRSVPGTGSP